MTVIHSDSVVLQDIYVDNSSDDKSSNVNTDGADTIYSNNITFERWIVRNGDDSISFKANSTNIYVKNCTFYDGIGLALGSIGQYKGQYETLENIHASNIIFNNTTHAAYIKTWTGVVNGVPPNGGGGGTGSK
jgi:galacturan 1,4-alpha-galacturonidase